MSLLILIGFFCLAQDMDSTLTAREQRNSNWALESLKIDFARESKLFTNTNQTIEYKEREALWNLNTYTQSELTQILDSVAENSTIFFSYEKGMDREYLTFRTVFPSLLKGHISEIFSIDILDNKIKQGNTEVGIRESQKGYGYGSNAIGSRLNYTLNLRFPAKNNKLNYDSLSGTVVFKSRIINGYKKLQVKKSDIGKVLTFGDCAFKVIDVLPHALVLDFDTIFPPINMSIININKNGREIVAGAEAYKSQISVGHYEAFKENSNLSLENYKGSFFTDYFNVYDKNLSKEEREAPFSKKYIVFNLRNIGDQFYLYQPSYLTKDFVVQYHN